MPQASNHEDDRAPPLAAEFSQSPTLVDALRQELATEQSPLLKRARSRSISRRRHSRKHSSTAGERHGDATVTQAVLMVNLICWSFRVTTSD